MPSICTPFCMIAFFFASPSASALPSASIAPPSCWYPPSASNIRSALYTLASHVFFSSASLPLLSFSLKGFSSTSRFACAPISLAACCVCTASSLFWLRASVISALEISRSSTISSSVKPVIRCTCWLPRLGAPWYSSYRLSNSVFASYHSAWLFSSLLACPSARASIRACRSRMSPSRPSIMLKMPLFSQSVAMPPTPLSALASLFSCASKPSAFVRLSALPVTLFSISIIRTASGSSFFDRWFCLFGWKTIRFSVFMLAAMARRTLSLFRASRARCTARSLLAMVFRMAVDIPAHAFRVASLTALVLTSASLRSSARSIRCCTVSRWSFTLCSNRWRSTLASPLSVTPSYASPPNICIAMSARASPQLSS